MVILENWAASLIGPSWFYGIDTIFQIMFVIITLLIYSLSVKAFKFSLDKKFKNLGLSFFFISLAFLILALSNLALYSGFYDGTVRGINFANLFYLAHVFFMLIGYSVLLLVSLKIKSKRVALLMFSFMLLFIAFAFQYYLKFHLVSLMMLVFIAYNFWENYLRKHSINSGLVFVTFYFLTIAELFFLCSVWMPTLYVMAQLMQMVGFLSILVMYKKVLK
jgi:hypothetical protein